MKLSEYVMDKNKDMIWNAAADVFGKQVEAAEPRTAGRLRSRI